MVECVKHITLVSKVTGPTIVIDEWDGFCIVRHHVYRDVSLNSMWRLTRCIGNRSSSREGVLYPGYVGWTYVEIKE
jgi:hypothetical protein